MVKFVADENLESIIINELRSIGYLVYSIREENQGTDDEDVLRITAEQNAILLTQDKDFGELVFRMQKAHNGVVLLRLTGLSPSEKGLICKSAIQMYEGELAKAFTVITKESIKIRKGT